MAMTKTEQAAMKALEREVATLKGHIETLEGRAAIPNAVGTVQLQGYSDPAQPLGNYFRVSITRGQSAGMEAVFDGGLLAIRCPDGTVMAMPSSSNVMHFTRGQLRGQGIELANPVPHA